jgi:hypothetical protein
MKQSPAFKNLDSSITPTKMQDMLDKGTLHSVYTSLKVSDKLLLRYIKQYGLTYKKAFKSANDLTESEKENISHDWCNTNLTKREIEEKYKIGTKALNRFIKQNQLLDREKVQCNTELIEYQKLVRRLTAVVIRHHGLKTVPGYDWDHKFSVFEGFQQKIHPNIVASRDNLELVPISANRSNGRKCSITRDELLNSVVYSSS